MVEGRILEESFMRSGFGLKGTARAVFVPLLIVSMIIMSRGSTAEDNAASAAGEKSPPADAPLGKKPPAPPKLPEPKGARRLDKDYPIWIDPKEKAVIVEGQVSLREGM